MLNNFIVINQVSIFDYLFSKIKLYFEDDNIRLLIISFDIKESSFIIYATPLNSYKFLSFKFSASIFSDTDMKNLCVKNYKNISEGLFEIYKILSTKSVSLIQEGILK